MKSQVSIAFVKPVFDSGSNMPVLEECFQQS